LSAHGNPFYVGATHAAKHASIWRASVASLE
jgi:hypothetical protein